jgi:flagellar biogenesis protein FliO
MLTRLSGPRYRPTAAQNEDTETESCLQDIISVIIIIIIIIIIMWLLTRHINNKELN